MTRFALVALLCAAPLGAAPVPKQPPRAAWPMFGGAPARNMANPAEKLGALPFAGPNWGEADQVKAWRASWVLWSADLGSRTYGSPVVAGGRAYIGTNNDRPRNPRDTQIVMNAPPEPLDKGALMCFDQKTGKFLWQAVSDHLPIVGVSDSWPKVGITSTPAVVGDRVYYVNLRGALVCLDANGFADGNDGIKTEKYATETDADVVWELDMRRELGVHRHCTSNGAPLVVGDRVFVHTGNGVDSSHINLPAPDAPSLICVDRNTGKVLWKDASPGKGVLHGQWSSPAYADDPVPQVIHGQGDGWLRAFDPATGKLLWQFDANAKYDLGGTGDKNDFVAMPVVYKGRVYIGTGQDPEHGEGTGNLWCVDLKKAVELGAKADARDVSPELLVRVEKLANGTERAITKPNPASAGAWRYGGPDNRRFAPRDHVFGRTLSTVAIADDVLYAAELGGYVHCLNATTGDAYWVHDVKASVWASPALFGDRVFLGTDAGDLFVYKHAAKPERFDAIAVGQGAANLQAARQLRRAALVQFERQALAGRVELDGPIAATPVAVGGVLFVATERTLFALKSARLTQNEPHSNVNVIPHNMCRSRALLPADGGSAWKLAFFGRLTPRPPHETLGFLGTFQRAPTVGKL
jgi:outer membrane protein assembly factor BamB